MDMKIKIPELKCMDPENYMKYFRALCWSGTKKGDKKQPRRFNKRDRLKKLKGAGAHAICYAPALLANPSQFAVFATVRRTILGRCRQLQAVSLDLSDDSDNEEVVPPANVANLSKVTIIGLRTVFALISQARYTDANLCEQTLKALLEVLQGHAPEDLSHEPNEIISNLHGVLVEISGSSWPNGRMDSPSKITSLSSSCLIALAVARGEAELILGTAASLIISSSALTEQYIQIPTNLTTLQRSVQSVILGPPSRNLWLHFGVPDKSLVRNFTVDLPTHLSKGEALIVRCLVSDGCYLYLFTSKGLLKIGSGYGSSIQQHVYLHKSDFFGCDRHSWLGYCKNKLYVRVGRKRTELHEVNKDTLEIKSIVRLDPGQSVTENKCIPFTDGNWLGLVILSSPDNLTIKMYDAESAVGERTIRGKHTLIARKEFTVQLLRRRTLVLGRPSFDDGLSRRLVDNDSPMAVQLDDNDDDPLSSVCAGQEFGLLLTSSGKVYYTGKGSSLGYKAPAPQTGRWTLMKETLFTRNEAPNIKRCRVTQIALGHEGVHAILVLDNGSALFTGIARRGEDGDPNKHRRSPKPTRPKKLLRTERHYIVYAACNYGSTALVTRQGELLMFGKDTQYCDESGLVTGLRHEKVIQVALGKAHAITLTTFGEVYSFGINNKGQCGREFGYTKEKFGPNRNNGKEEARICAGGAHLWIVDYCRVCVLCRQCTGFAGACHCSVLPNRYPGDHCGCGEGNSGCSVCGVCQRCGDASTSTAATNADQGLDNEGLQSQLESSSSSSSSGLESGSNQQPQAGSGSEFERETSVKVNCLAPGRVIVPGGHRIMSVACGLHHSVLLSEHGELFTFGSNLWGALGAGDIANHHRIIRVQVPRALSVAAGSNHTAVLTREGDIYTFGSFQKGSLGRAKPEDRQDEEDEAPRGRGDRAKVWYAVPGRVPGIGPRYGCRAVWICASGDQTFVQIQKPILRTDFLHSATITANSNTIIILPNQAEHNFKCVTINKNDGSCTSWTGPEQVDFVNTLACLDPMYDVLWGFQPQTRVMKCYNIIAFDSHKLQRCCDNDPEAFADSEFDYPYYGSMKRLEDIRHVESFESMTNSDHTETQIENSESSNMSILNQELAIPCTSGFQVTRIHAALHLLGCVDSLTYAYDNKPSFVDCIRYNSIAPVPPVIEDYLTVNRFENHGGGWGYTGHSVEAIRFMCESDILLGGVGLYGGRGEYNAKIRLYDIGPDGSDQEPEGEMVYETDEVFYECAPNDKYPLMFETPFPVVATKWYVVAASINGPSSDCGSSGQPMITNEEITFHFKTSKKSNNGTDVNAGQIPCLLYNTMSPNYSLAFRHLDLGEPVVILSRNLSRKVTVSCFRSLITLLHWSWRTFRDILMNTNGLVPINYQKLSVMKHQKRLVYVIRSALRIVKSYIIEVHPQYVKKKNTPEYMSYFDSIVEVRNFVQAVMAEPTPNCTAILRTQGQKTHKTCYVQFALELTNCILKETHEMFIACFYAFFPTPTLKWNHLCFMLYHVRDGSVPESQVFELTATCAAMCHSQSLRDVLQYIVPFTQSHTVLQDARKADSKTKEVPSKSATVPRSSHAQKPPPVPPRAKDPQKSNASEEKLSHLEWHLLDIVPRLLDVVLNPIMEKLTPVQCTASHDHGEIKKQERLAEYCCKLIARIIAEMSSSAIQYPKDDVDENTIKQLVTASRFMRVNTVRAWRTGYGSPDAICFTVDRPGVALCGACVFVGLGRYNYSIELLQDMRTSSEEANPTHCWISCQTSEGSFSSNEASHEMVQVKFTRPILLRDDTRYALRFCCEGVRTASGDCGLPAVTGPDGTTFQFSTCSLSFNGTTLARGQLPCLIYYRTKWISGGNEGAHGTAALYGSDNVEDLEWERGTAREAAIAVAIKVAEKCGALLAAYKSLPPDELRRAVPLLVATPALNTLLPHALANLEELNDSNSVVYLLEIIRKLLPDVAAINHEMPSVEDVAPTVTTGQYYTWVESDHPYKPATVINQRVLFPPSVSWIVLEMDPRSITSQSEDTLTVYAIAGAPRHRCHCVSEARVPDPPIRKRLLYLNSKLREAEELDEICTDAPCMHYNCTYASVTPKLSNIPMDRPQKTLLVPGNEVLFSLETASDYLNDYNRSNNEEGRFGFRCLCVGYEEAPFTNIKTGGSLGGLVTLEMELVHLGASCAAQLLTPDLDVPPLTHGTIMEVQMQAMISSGGGSSSEDVSFDETESLLLSRGLELGSPPTVHSVLDGLPLLRSISTERQFLSDFVAGEETTAGGRLARWLAPGPRVEPSRCELKPPVLPARPAARLSLPIIIRDQYGDIVCSPAVKIEVVVQRIEDSALRAGRGLASACGENISNVPYQPTIQNNTWYHSISMMKPYENFSFEELRFASGAWGGFGSYPEGIGGAGRIPAERIPIDAHRDGSYSAIWMPRTPGTYLFRCTLDDYPTAQDLKIDVEEYKTEDLAERWLGSVARHRLRRYLGEDSAGLRVRASPSLQAATIGRIPPGAYIAIADEVANRDGTWVRLSMESAHTYAESATGTAWCLQYHGHLDRRLLLTVDELESQDEFVANWSAAHESQTEVPDWIDWKDDVDDIDVAGNDLSLDDQQFPFSIECDLESESDSSSSPYEYGEPSKRRRQERNESTSMPTPRRVPRNNGNSDELSPVRSLSSEDLREVDSVPETDILGQQETLPTRVAQTGTQTSPENTNDGIANSQFEAPKEDDQDSQHLSRDRFVVPRSWLTGSPPPAARPIKYALSPAQGECLRSVFAALLWHEGIVHDAIACATFLKFHPQLPKAGARVVTRPPHDPPSARPQRHSVEVFNTGQSLHIHPSTLEMLTRSGIEASTSRAHRTVVDMETREEEAGPSSAPDFEDPIAGPSCSVVNVLPPALRALVALWDVLNDAEQLSAATDKYDGFFSCELCGGRDVPPPLAAHMRNAHPGCKAFSNRGYDRAGKYKQADFMSNDDNPMSECGKLAQDLIGVKIRATLVAYQLWYIYCEKCRERSLKATAEQRQREREPTFEGATPDLDHQTMRDNAVFLLDLAPLINTEASSSGWRDSSGKSPPTPPGSKWQPAPPFQCLPALGAAPKPMSDAARYHSLGRPLPATIEELPSTSGEGGAQTSRVPRSVSMGQAGGRDLAHAAWPPLSNNDVESQDKLSGLSLLTQPSAALQKLVGGVDWTSEACAVSAFETPPVDSEALMRSAVLEFILAKRELPACRQKMDAAVRINTIRQYAFEAFNWLLRSTTQPTSVHDVMWWFCNAIDKFARIVPTPVSVEDNKENVANDWSRYTAPTASAAAICPGGRAASGARAAFHAFLGSVSALAPSLPPASAAALQAVRCWALHYSQHDRTFLHRSQVFSVISKILSHNEDDTYEEGMAGALHESYQSYTSKPNYLYTCPDVTGWCDVTVSSRMGMAGSLTDGSTETFWESGDDDRSKAKWIQISYARPSYQEKPHIICIHVDNTRDALNKTLLITFLYGSGTSDLTHMQDVEVDPKAATWISYTLPKSNCYSVRVRCELRGPEAAVRVRQIRALGAPMETPNPYTHHPLHSLTERDTLRVFRLLTQQVFGKLLDWAEYSSSESGEGVVVEEVAGDDSDLREHVVGILFAGHKLTSLQRQVMSHIVCSIGCEASRVREDWESALLTTEALDRNDDDSPPVMAHHQQDNYCFEILSLLLALSGSAVGRSHLAQRTDLLADLLSLLHTGSERVQRQVISLIRRVIAEVPPQKILAALNYASDASTTVTLLDHLLSYVGKALSVQVKIKGGGATSPRSVTLGSSVTPALPAAWFMRGDTTKRHANSVAKLITDMAEDKISEVWGVETRRALVQYVRAVAQVEDMERRPQRCVTMPCVWLALAALCVCDPEYMDFVNGPNQGGPRTRQAVPDPHPLCANHDDGVTAGVIDCRTCGTLCSECDRVLHLNRTTRNHQRKICKEEETAIRLDIHEGCGRAKLHWLLLLVDRRTFKALMEFRGIESGNMSNDGGVVLSGICRFCGIRGNTGLLAIGNICADQQCQEHAKEACNRVLTCGHSCGGVRGERTCLPCLYGCSNTETLRQDADDMCMICFTDPLQAAPAIQLGCGHVFHINCCKKVLTNKWVGPRITFSFSQCPICKENMSHEALEQLLVPIRALRDEVSRKALMRLEYEGMAAGASHSRAQEDPATYAMERYAYYVCHKCGKAYFGGLARCEAESNGSWEPSELVCGGCSDVTGARMCPKHGTDFLEYKCRYCCSVAVFFCFGTSHFCNACHDDFQRVTNLSRHLLPQCPAGPKGIQLPGTPDECPLHVQHPPTGEEFALGCGICRHAHSF